MSEPFRTRTFVPVPPEERPVKQRLAVRVLVRDTEGAYLLLRDTDPGVPGSTWWMTPGGGIDPGESAAEAAAREVREETGLVLSPGDVGEPIAYRTVAHGYCDQVTVQDETFFTVAVPRFQVSADGYTDEERLTLQGHAWLTPDAADGVPVWPADLAELGRLAPGARAELGLVEESTVPVALGCRDPERLRGWTAGPASPSW